MSNFCSRRCNLVSRRTFWLKQFGSEIVKTPPVLCAGTKLNFPPFEQTRPERFNWFIMQRKKAQCCFLQSTINLLRWKLLLTSLLGKLKPSRESFTYLSMCCYVKCQALIMTPTNGRMVDLFLNTMQYYKPSAGIAALGIAPAWYFLSYVWKLDAFIIWNRNWMEPYWMNMDVWVLDMAFENCL